MKESLFILEKNRILTMKKHLVWETHDFNPNFEHIKKDNYLKMFKYEGFHGRSVEVVLIVDRNRATCAWRFAQQ